MIRVLFLFCLFFISGCAVKGIDLNVDGYVNPDSCGDRWVCEGEPICDDENYRFLCERWE